MSTRDALKALIDARLAICAVAGCSNTFEPSAWQLVCGRDDCARNERRGS